MYGCYDDHICGCPILTSMSAAGDLITFRVRYFVISDIALSKLISGAVVNKNGIKMRWERSSNKGSGYDWLRFPQLLYQSWLLHNSTNKTTTRGDEQKRAKIPPSLPFGGNIC